MPSPTSSSGPAPTTTGEVARGLRALVPAVLGTALLLWIDGAVRAFALGGHPLANLFAAPLYLVLLWLLPPLIATTGLVVVISMMRNPLGVVGASILLAISVVAYPTTTALSAEGTVAPTWVAYWLVMAVAGAGAGIVWTRSWPRVRRIVVTLAIGAVALLLLGLGG